MVVYGYPLIIIDKQDVNNYQALIKNNTKYII